MKHRLIRINDTTLRDGEQAPGLAFSQSEKIQIVKALIDIGIHDIEVGIAATLDREPTYLEFLKGCDQRDQFSLWCRANTDDIEKAAAYGFGLVHISFPVSDFQLQHMGKSRDWVFRHVENCITHCYQFCDEVSIGAQDATRSDPAFLIEFIQLLNAYGVKRLRFSDTVGISIPSSVAKLTATMRAQFRGSLEFHGHNDLGLATANCLSAVQNGVDEVSVTVNGIGERAGNAALEQVAAALQFGLGIQTDIHLPSVSAICEMVSTITGQQIPASAPITGSAVFSHESGIHCNGQLKHPLMYQPFCAEEFGRTSQFVLGKHSGSSSVRAILAQKGFHVSKETAQTLLAKAREHSANVDAHQLVALLFS